MSPTRHGEVRNSSPDPSTRSDERKQNLPRATTRSPASPRSSADQPTSSIASSHECLDRQGWEGWNGWVEEARVRLRFKAQHSKKFQWVREPKAFWRAELCSALDRAFQCSARSLSDLPDPATIVLEFAQIHPPLWRIARYDRPIPLGAGQKSCASLYDLFPDNP
ncbi:MAG: hypothetical protein ACI9UA_002220 [Pseudoalteromonas tetraodonis]|jgi:hypothetical protein